MQFTLSIKLGNDAMQTGEDIAEALHSVAYVVEQSGRANGSILDANGNIVGSWMVSAN